MITLLAKIFIKDRENIGSSAVRSAYGKLCGALGIVLNLLLFACKLTAGALSGAISVMSDAFNNLTDAASSIITLLGFRMSEQKADKDHPFGHGRIEYVAGLIVSMIIMLVGFELARSSVEKIVTPEKVSLTLISAVILCASVLVKAYMAYYNFKIGKKIGSAAIKAAASDSLSDCAATLTVLFCLLITHFTNVNIDAYCGLAVSVFILYSGLRSVKETVDPLLGTPPSRETIEKIEKIVLSRDEVEGIHDLIVHDYGPGRSMISLHAEVSADADLLTTHDMIDNIEKELREKLGCDAVIHMDPIVTDDESVLALKDAVIGIVKELDERLTIHDFRVVSGPTHTNVIFDVVVPFDIGMSDRELRDRISHAVRGINETYFTVINIDRAYI